MYVERYYTYAAQKKGALEPETAGHGGRGGCRRLGRRARARRQLRARLLRPRRTVRQDRTCQGARPFRRERPPARGIEPLMAASWRPRG